MIPIKQILLINPPIQDFYQTEIRQQSLGLKYIQAVLESAGYQTFLLDCLACNKRQTIPIPEQLSYLKAYYLINDLSPYKLFTHYRHFGLSFEEISKRLQNYQPDLIGISINFTPYFGMAIEIARICKSIFPKVPIVAGGHHATAVPEKVFETGLFDFVILGEGEERILRLIDALLKDDTDSLKAIDGIAYREQDHIVINPIQSYIQNLDQLPKLKIKDDVGMLITSRGCPKSCNFCSIAKVMGKKVRLRSIESVLNEMEIGIKNGVHQFDFEDDHLTINQMRAKKLFKEIANRFSNYNLTLSAMNGMLADSLDEELIAMMKVAGFEWLNIPLVSGSQAIQSSIERNQSYHYFSNVVTWAQKYGLKVVAYLILGLPEDTLDQMMDDIIFLADLPVLIGPSIFYPPPGSITFENCVRRGYISGVDYLLYRSSAVPVETENFSRCDLITLFRIVRIINFLKKIIDEHLNSNQYLSHFVRSRSIQSVPLKTSRKLSQEAIGMLLIEQLFQHQRLRGFTLIEQKNEEFLYDWINYEIAPAVVSKFINKIQQRKIAGISKPFHFELSD